MQCVYTSVCLLIAGCTGGVSAQTIISGSSVDAAGLAPTVDAFRASLGALNANAPQSFAGGRREINWDAVPDTLSAPNAFPGNFFNQNFAPRARGAVFSTPGSGFQVSADNDNPTLTPNDFQNIDPSYGTNFNAFSPQRLFTAIGSTITDVTFFMPNNITQSATVRGFGAVFSDVDLSGSARIDVYDTNNELLSSVAAPAFAGDGTFSFAGVTFDAAVIARVRITSGTDALGAGVLDAPSLGRDLVVMDDFIYGEMVPTPGAAALLCAGGVLVSRRRR